MTTPKRKISVSLDADLVAELEAGGGGLSTQVNEAVRIELDGRRRQRLLGEYLDDLARRVGPPDEEGVQRFMKLLGG